MREYGRHVQKMIEHILTIEEPERRQRNAQAAIELMGFLNPHLKNVEDFRHKLWDHLFLIADFKLDVKSPYPIPTREELKARPAPMPYPKHHPKFSHLGRNLEIIINKALKEEDPDNIEQYSNKADNQIKKAITLIDTAGHKKEASEIYVVLSMIRRCMVYVNPMTYGRDYGIAATKYATAAYHYNSENPRALYLLGWEKYATPRQYGGDKAKAKEYLLQAKEKLESNTATGDEPRWGKTEVNDILKKLK